jgi:hypothetical protein
MAMDNYFLDSFVVFFSFFPAVPVRVIIVTDTRRSVVLFEILNQTETNLDDGARKNLDEISSPFARARLFLSWAGTTNTGIEDNQNKNHTFPYHKKRCLHEANAFNGAFGPQAQQL